MSKKGEGLGRKGIACNQSQTFYRIPFAQQRGAIVQFDWLLARQSKYDIRNLQWYRIVFARICEHVSSAFIFASKCSDQFSHASREHFRNYKWRAASTSLIFRQLESLFITEKVALLQIIWLTPSKLDNRRKARQHVKILSRFNHPQQLTANHALFYMLFAAKILHLASRESVCVR